jgi:hypothetical protein
MKVRSNCTVCTVLYFQEHRQDREYLCLTASTRIQGCRRAVLGQNGDKYIDGISTIPTGLSMKAQLMTALMTALMEIFRSGFGRAYKLVLSSSLLCRTVLYYCTYCTSVRYEDRVRQVTYHKHFTSSSTDLVEYGDKISYFPQTRQGPKKISSWGITPCFSMGTLYV